MGCRRALSERPVSIHAPARGATTVQQVPFGAQDVSIHAPARGATPRRRRSPRCCRGFNPRAREGRDHEIRHRHGRCRRFQSTRPRGARPQHIGLLAFGFDGFNPRAREGRDYSRAVRRARPRRFNPRAREGRDHTRTAVLSLYGTFQSTRPRGARPSIRCTSSTPQTFQSTRPRGARPSGVRPMNGESTVSIHAPARGATYPDVARGNIYRGFNPRAREGRDQYSMDVDDGERRFQSTRPRGARRAVRRNAELGASVSIHAPARGATSNQPKHGKGGGMFQSTRPRGARLTRHRRRT